jgi:micrococcal nuclease
MSFIKRITILIVVINLLFAASYYLSQAPSNDRGWNQDEEGVSFMLPPKEVSEETSFLNSDKKEINSELYLVTRVVDGDTIEVEINGERKRVRYIGVDTPETVHPSKPVQCYGKEASEYNKKLVEGKWVRLEKDISETDKYDRLLRYVYVGDMFVNFELVSGGFASVITYPPDVKYIEKFLNAVKIARAENRGLWGAGCERESSWVYTPTTPIQNSGGEGGSCIIKGNINADKVKIYHVPSCEYYDKTIVSESYGERWFCTEEEALGAGWRRALNCS